MENKSQISSGTLLRLALISPDEREVGKEILFLWVQINTRVSLTSSTTPKPHFGNEQGGKTLLEQEVGMLSRGDGDGRGAVGAPR